MNEKFLTNVRIIDPSQKMDEHGSVVVDENGKIKLIGKDVKKKDASSSAEVIDLKNNILIPSWGRYFYSYNAKY